MHENSLIVFTFMKKLEAYTLYLLYLSYSYFNNVKHLHKIKKNNLDFAIFFEERIGLLGDKTQINT